ncbi:hypothetical protein R3P38DRAFT_329231 [Favolaschia claudopus]|uniref:Uncharacterized protein n=1 Tax=Favolaschia claudopus TaxID=2862362 RepID=A0AAV9ZMX1_9AGAR
MGFGVCGRGKVGDEAGRGRSSEEGDRRSVYVRRRHTTRTRVALRRRCNPSFTLYCAGPCLISHSAPITCNCARRGSPLTLRSISPDRSSFLSSLRPTPTPHSPPSASSSVRVRVQRGRRNAPLPYPSTSPSHPHASTSTLPPTPQRLFLRRPRPGTRRGARSRQDASSHPGAQATGGGDRMYRRTQTPAIPAQGCMGRAASTPKDGKA